jgi:phosphate transport system substrate-binding protein
MRMWKRVPVSLVAAWALLVTACNQPQSNDPSNHATAHERLQGAGSSFDDPLFSKVFDSLAKEKGIEVNYQPIGSGGGVLQLTKGTVDFAASDFPMNEEQTRAAEQPAVLSCMSQ